ncbi:MAG: general secretion pathway protein GspK [Gammaproteobacteria bacterium]|nr:general secretion pathway protein GspK [Gammaproteobacteria bacterium]
MRPQRGFALLLVIWALVLLLSLATGFGYAVRHELRFGSDLSDSVKAEAASLAALHQAILALGTTDDETRWQPDSAARVFTWPQGTVTVKVISENGRIDINGAPVELLRGLFEQLLPDHDAAALADAVLDWRDRDDNPQPFGAEESEYLAAGYAYAPMNQPFGSTSELSQVFGFDRETTEIVQPYLTVYSRRPRINAYSADLVTLAAVPGITLAMAEAFVADREAAAANEEKPDFSILGNGKRYVDTTSSSNLFAIDMTTTITNGGKLRRQVVVALQGRNGFLVLDHRPMPTPPTEPQD